MLKLLGNIYGRIATVRNSLFDRGILKSHSLGARTISIGNITTGGTGKTPLVAVVAEILAAAGEKVCILTRGYGRENERQRVLVSDRANVLVDARKGGDEPVELARKLLGKAIVVADADRVSAAAWARNEFGVTTFVLDDAFQHRRAQRDLDIVCIDATNPYGGGHVLPRGTLREPFKNLARADVVVITRSDLLNIQIERFVEAFTTLIEFVPSTKDELDEWYIQAERLKTFDHPLESELFRYLTEFFWHYLSDADIRMKDEAYAAMQGEGIIQELEDLKQSVNDLTRKIRANSSTARIFVTRTEIVGLRSLSEFEQNQKQGSGRIYHAPKGDRLRVLAFCALGNPAAFFAQLSLASNDKLDPSLTYSFPDHHHYTRSDVSMLEEKARAGGVEALLTTAKDAVKLEGLTFELPCYVVDIEVKLDDPNGFRDLILSA